MIILNGPLSINQTSTLQKANLNYYANYTQNISNINYIILAPVL